MYKLAINRPITILMGVLTFVVFGLISYNKMPVSLFPNIDFPVVTIQTAYPGADAETVESKVTDAIEEAVSGIDGIDKITSTSFEGLSMVVVTFELERDITEAANDVRDKIGALSLPNDVEKAVVKKVNTTGSVINLFVASKSGDDKALMLLADEKLKPKLQRVRNVGEVTIVGFRDREIRVFTSPYLLNKYGVSVSELENAVKSENFRATTGKLVTAKEELLIKLRGDANTVEKLQNLVIKPGVRLKDVATVEDSLSDANSYAGMKNRGVMLEIKKISGTNALDIITGVKALFPELQKAAGEGYELKFLQDESEKIIVNIDRVKFDLAYGAVLAILIVFFFLRNVTATFLAALAIPISIIGTFWLMDIFGYDLNKLSLIGLTLAIGIFIDDAIVVIENITKKMEAGMEAFEATFLGIKEISFSVLSISAMLLAVFIPIAFMAGMVGKFFNSFAVTVASGVIISYLVAVMFIPAVGARLLRAKESLFFRITEPFFAAIDRGYAWLLRYLVRFKFLTLIALGSIIFLSLGAGKGVGMDFVPMEDNSEIQVIIRGKVGMSLEEMKRQASRIQEIVEENKLVEYSVLSIGYGEAKEAHKAKIYTKLKPLGERTMRQDEVVQSFRDKFASIKGLIISVEEVPPFATGQSNAPVQVVITGDSLETLDKVSLKVMEYLKGVKGAVNIDRDFEDPKPEIRVSILRENAKRAGVSSEQIAGLLRAAFFSDQKISTFEENGKQYDITLRFNDKERKSIEDLKKLQIRASNGKFVYLEGLIKIEKNTSMALINRFDRQRKVMVTANIHGVALNAIVQALDEGLPKLMPQGYTYRYTGEIERMAETGAAFAGAVALAVILIYLILAALYESLIQPFIIMVSMPLSFTGVIVALGLSGNNFSLFVMIGLILLLGMVGKNAILVVDFANRAVKEGKSVEDALVEAGEKRLRPILMTTFAMIGAMLPLAFGTGAGFESNSPMAMAIIGGLISSTFLTLMVVPAIYRLLYPVDTFLRKFYEKGKV